MVVSGSVTVCRSFARSVPGGENPMKVAGPRRNLRGPYSWVSDGSRKPSPQVLRRVRLSSNGCQRTPTLGTHAFVSLFSHSSYRTPAENSKEENPGMWYFGLKIGMIVSA